MEREERRGAEAKKEKKKEWKAPAFPHHRPEEAQEEEGYEGAGMFRGTSPSPTFCLCLRHRLGCPADEYHCDKQKQGTESPLFVPMEPDHRVPGCQSRACLI